MVNKILVIPLFKSIFNGTFQRDTGLLHLLPTKNQQKLLGLHKWQKAHFIVAITYSIWRRKFEFA